ncbi:hypothetical protein V8F20_011242 [Naviculisporaceae sp. PSN 640]
MRFSIFSTALMALSGTVTATLRPDDLVTSIGTLTAKTQALLEPAGTLSLANAALLLVKAGPWQDILDGLSDITDTAKQQIVVIQSAEENPTKLAGAEAELVTDAVEGLLNVLSELLQTITGKTGLVQSLPLVGDLLTPVLELLDSLLTTLIDTILEQLDELLGEVLKTDVAEVSSLIAELNVGL